MPIPDFDHEVLKRLLYDSLNLLPSTRIAVGFSGGMDSTALLLGLAGMLGENSKEHLLALHFNHSLHPAANEWQKHCELLCRQMDISILCGKWHRNAGASVSEGAARTARYEWFLHSLPASHVLLLAHHRDDQIETVLMSLLEGRNIHRVAGMKKRRPLVYGDAREVIRPLLDVPRTSLRKFVESSGLDWVEDPSNQDPSHRRVWLRNQVIPQLRNHCDGLDDAVIGSTRSLRKLIRLRERHIRRYLDQVMVPDAKRIFCRCLPLSVEKLQKLKSVDLEGVLCKWIHSGSLIAPAGPGMNSFLRTLQTSSTETERHHLRLDWKRASIREYRGMLYLHGELPVPSEPIPWNGEDQELLPGMTVRLQADSGREKCTSDLSDLVWCWRTGGERVWLPGRSHHTTLKKACQMLGIPAWERECVPHLEKNGEIVWHHGIGWCGQNVNSSPDTQLFGNLQIILKWNPTAL